MELRAYQKEDVEFIVKNKICGIFSEQRTGKTPTAIVALNQLNLKRILVVCPASIVYNWELEFNDWSNIPVKVVQSTSKDEIDLSFEGAYIVNYEKFRGSKKKQELLEALLIWNPQGVVVDEAHRMQDRKSLTAVAIMKFVKCPVKLALTGTPCTNKPWNIWSILHWLKPREYSSYWNFVNEYFYSQPMYVGGQTFHQPVAFRGGKDKYLMAKLSTFCTQRKRREVMQWLTDDDSVTNIPLKPSVSVGKIIKELETWYQYKQVICKTQLDTMIRVRQVLLDPRILELKGKSEKTEWIKQYVSDYAEDENILIFSNSKKYLKLLSDELNANLICGDTKPEDRVKYVKDFQTHGGLLLCQTQACKEGLTLDNADTTIFTDLFPPSADYLQAKDRMVATSEERNKPKKLLRVYYKDTLDEQCIKTVDSNIELSDLINSYSQHLKEMRKEQDGSKNS